MFIKTTNTIINLGAIRVFSKYEYEGMPGLRADGDFIGCESEEERDEVFDKACAIVDQYQRASAAYRTSHSEFQDQMMSLLRKAIDDEDDGR